MKISNNNYIPHLPPKRVASPPALPSRLDQNSSKPHLYNHSNAKDLATQTDHTANRVQKLDEFVPGVQRALRSYQKAAMLTVVNEADILHGVDTYV